MIALDEIIEYQRGDQAYLVLFCTFKAAIHLFWVSGTIHNLRCTQLAVSASTIRY